MGLSYTELDEMTLYEFRLYEEGYAKRMEDFTALVRPVAYYSMVGPGMLPNPPTMEEFWPIGKQVKLVEAKGKNIGMGTQKWSQKKRDEWSKYFTDKLKDHKWD